MTDDDETQGRRVVVLGVESRDQLFSRQAGNRRNADDERVSVYRDRSPRKEKAEMAATEAGPITRKLFRFHMLPWRAIIRPVSGPGIFKGWINNLVVEVGDPAHS